MGFGLRGLLSACSWSLLPDPWSTLASRYCGFILQVEQDLACSFSRVKGLGTIQVCSPVVPAWVLQNYTSHCLTLTQTLMYRDDSCKQAVSVLQLKHSRVFHLFWCIFNWETNATTTPSLLTTLWLLSCSWNLSMNQLWQNYNEEKPSFMTTLKVVHMHGGCVHAAASMQSAPN